MGILAELTTLGIDARLIDGKLKLAPAAKVSSALIQKTAAHRSVLVGEIAQRDAVVLPVVGQAIKAAPVTHQAAPLPLDNVLAVLGDEDLEEVRTGSWTVEKLRFQIRLIGDYLCRQRGDIPPSYRHEGSCLRCGPVYLPTEQAGHDKRVCPWCENRAACLPIPRPSE